MSISKPYLDYNENGYINLLGDLKAKITAIWYCFYNIRFFLLQEFKNVILIYQISV